VERPERGVSEIATPVNRNRTTVHRRLTTLEIQGAVQREHVACVTGEIDHYLVTEPPTAVIVDTPIAKSELRAKLTQIRSDGFPVTS
jgi:predicted transcriptional regulator